MGTSNWQQIPFCIDALMKIAPSSVLDVGVGFGRWGMIVREFCDVWFQRVLKDEWKVRLEGIEAFPRSITDYHTAFYNHVHIGDAAELIPTLRGPWSLTIYGDVLEHFTKETAHKLLNASLDTSDYVIVNIPIGEDYEQGDLYGNEFERHRSSWQVADFKPFALVRHALFQDFQTRDYGSFILSRHDPKNLKTALFCSLPRPDALPDEGELDRVLERIAEQSFELGFIKQSSSYRLAGKFRKAPLGRMARRFRSGDANRVLIRPRPIPGSDRGAEAWVLSVHATPEEPGVPWDFVERSPDFWLRPSDGSAYGQCLCGHGGEVAVRTGPDPKVRFLTHAWSTLVDVEFNGRSETIDLSSYKDGWIAVYPARTPMVDPSAEKRSLENGEPAIEMPGRARPERFTAEEQATIRRLKQLRPSMIAVHCPRWLGVSNSTRALFGDAACYALPQSPQVEPITLSIEELKRHAAMIAAAGIKHIVVSGGDTPHLRLVDLVHELAPDTVCDMLWHGSYVQISEDYVWLMLQRWIEAVKAGRVRSILTVKAGMDEFFRANGVPSTLLKNFVPGEVLPPPVLETDETHVGLWLAGPSFRKCPHAMICALSMLRGEGDLPPGCPDLSKVRLHAAGLEPRARELVKALKIPATIAPEPLRQDKMLKAIRSTHLSLYVTFSECCPMLPLESLQQGVPCLVGPVSHLFEDDKYLFDRLVVPCPDRADTIAAYARRAIIEREEIIARWAQYAPRYNELAKAGVVKFLAEGPGPVPGEAAGQLAESTA